MADDGRQYHEVRVVVDKHGRGEVFIDGRALKGVRAFSASGGVNRVTQINLSLIAVDVDIEAEANVVVDATHIGSGTHSEYASLKPS